MIKSVVHGPLRFVFWCRYGSAPFQSLWLNPRGALTGAFAYFIGPRRRWSTTNTKTRQANE